MSVITFLSDFGIDDHYVAAVKASILKVDPRASIIDISHMVDTGHIAQASFILKSVFRDFPERSVHLIALDDPQRAPTGMIAVEMESHYFVGPDNGVIGLLSDTTSYKAVDINPEKRLTTFPAKNLLGPVSAKLGLGASLEEVGAPMESFKKMLGRHLRANQTQLIGNVLHVDHYGNLITNIDKATFEKLTTGQSYFISFGKESSRVVHKGYFQVEPGDCFVVFNDQGLLEIGIKHGNASHLMGLEFDSTVIVNIT